MKKMKFVVVDKQNDHRSGWFSSLENAIKFCNDLIDQTGEVCWVENQEGRVVWQDLEIM